MNDLTRISHDAFDQALTMPSRQAAQWLLNYAHFRSLRDKLIKYFPPDVQDPRGFLRDAFYASHPDAKERDSIRVLINNWFAQRGGLDDRTVSRGYAIEMCFILKLSLDGAERFMRDVAGEGLRYRHVDEFAAAYAIENRQTYADYLRLKERIHEQLDALPAEKETDAYTIAAFQAVQKERSEEELIQYICEHRAEFGAARNTAYRNFMDMLNALQGEGALEEIAEKGLRDELQSSRETVGEIVKENLYRRLVQKGKRLSPVAKSIRAGWPEEAQISRMKSREVNVSRKVLIMLFLACGGEGQSRVIGDEWEEADWEDSESDADFEGIYLNLNAMLMESGFAPLDPRQPFDWMVLCCMASGDLFEVDERMTAMLEQLFGNDAQA